MSVVDSIQIEAILARHVQQHSAGGVVLKCESDGASVLLIKPRGRNRWQLPKGNVDSGETPEMAAVREVREEGGVDATILGPLSPITFFYQMYGQKFVKSVDFYAMSFVSGSTLDHDDEVDEARWFTAEEAVRTLTFASERQAVNEALEHLEGQSASLASPEAQSCR